MLKIKAVYVQILITVFLINISIAQTSFQEDIPQRIILNLTTEPATSIAVTWRTVNEYPKSVAQFAVATSGIEFEKSETTVEAKIEKVKTDENNFVYHYSTILNNLKQNTLYAYRVGHDSVWSEWSQFKTAYDKNTPFVFIYLGDPQNDIKKLVSRIFREAFKVAPYADFWLFSGDLISKPWFDSLWDEFFYAAGFIPRMTPSIMVPGNHEYPTTEINGIKKKDLTHLWKPHFTLPENGVKGLEETSYFVDYQDVRFIMLDGNIKLNEQAKWMENLLADNPNKWTIVTIHQPMYSTAEDRDNKHYREIFMRLYDKYSVDLVLQGHDHVYARTYKLKDGKVVNKNKKGTIYLISVSGPKFYQLNHLYKDLMQKTGENLQLFQVISINKNELEYKAYTVTGELFDSFKLSK